MAILNAANLLNLGAEATKPAVASQTALTQNNGADAFAQTLRKQMQQSSKPALPAAKTETAKPANAAQTPTAQSSSGDRAQKTADQQNEAVSNTAQTTDAAAQEADGKAVAENAVTETPQERKKRLLAALADTEATAISQTNPDQTTIAISPWMQSMLAMRPQTGNSETTTASAMSLDVQNAKQGELTMQADVSPLTTSTEMAHSTDKTPPTGIASTDPALAQAKDQSKDFKQLLGDTARTAGPEVPLEMSDTLVNDKLMATMQETGADRHAFNQLHGAETQSDLMGTSSALTAAQPLSSQSWMTTAGVANNTMVMSQIATPFGNERWQTAMNQHVMNMVSGGDEVASLTLSPPDLGPIQVVLQVDNQSVNTSFVTDNPLVRQALEDGMQDLRDRMQSQGLQLGQTFIGNGQQAQQHFEQQTAQQGSAAVAARQEAETVSAPQTAVRTTTPLGLVDTFV